jgi:excisionase family DNA binding protein
VTDRELYSIEQARALLGGIARNTIYQLIRSGELASVPIGRRRFISAAAIEAFIATTTTTEPPEARSLRTASRAVQMRLGLRPPSGVRLRRERSRR